MMKNRAIVVLLLLSGKHFSVFLLSWFKNKLSDFKCWYIDLVWFFDSFENYHINVLVISVYLLFKATIDEQFGVDGCHRDNVTIVLLYPPGMY